MALSVPSLDNRVYVEIRVRGRVQGVGFRPTVWRYARELGLAGAVFNDATGVLIRACGSDDAIAALIARLQREPPPLARIDAVETQPYVGTPSHEFVIADSVGGDAHTQITPDAVTCPACAEEIANPSQRRYRYPFTNCTHCGPRLSIVTSIPYDRAKTTMAPFPLCPACRAEYDDPSDRRFHAEAIACDGCGPQARLMRMDGQPLGFDRPSAVDGVDATRRLIESGEIVAIKGIGGYQLACDATNAGAVARLRQRKRRDAKPFALMARDLAAIRRYCNVGAEEEQLLSSPAAPIVLLRADGAERLPDAVAPGLTTLGFMLPTTPLHLLMLQEMSQPVVMTSGNLSDEPQVIADADAGERLGGIAAYVLTHDRAIANRIDDSVVRVAAGRPRLLRRARGYAPAPISLPKGFEAAPDLLAMGGELKATFCLVKDGAAIVSQHQGDLEDVATFDGYRKNLLLYATLFDHAPAALVADMHPEYLSSKLARERAAADSLPLLGVQHHHAHVAACLAENGYALEDPAVLGIALDGLGWGDDGTCSAFGGIHAMKGNPTGCMGVNDYLGWDWKSKAGLPVVNVPGCPVQPDNFMETVLYLLRQLAGLAPMIPVDDVGRPKWLFEQTVHQGCDRAGYYEVGDFATEYGSPKCIVKLGCWGPVVQCNVPKRGWMAGIGGCPNVGGICIGCTMPGFPDKFMPFMDEPPGAVVSSTLIKPYGWIIRALRPLTKSTLNDEPKWRHNRPELTTGYQPRH